MASQGVLHGESLHDDVDATGEKPLHLRANIPPGHNSLRRHKRFILEPLRRHGRHPVQVRVAHIAQAGHRIVAATTSRAGDIPLVMVDVNARHAKSGMRPRG